MATATSAAPSREDFAKLLDESFGGSSGLQEGSVIKGTVVGIEKDLAVIDVGLKTEGRVALREFAGPGRQQRDQDRRHRRGLPGARRERARRGGALARQGAPRGELGQARDGVQEQREGHGRHLQPGQGRLHRRSRRRGGVPAALAGRHPADPRRHPADERQPAVPDPEDGSPPRQHRRVAPHRAGRDPRRAAPGTGAEPRRGPGHRRRGQEHHRLRRVRRPRRHRRPAARHRHRLAARQSPDRGAQHRPAGEGQDHQDQPRDPPHLARHEAAARRSVAGHRGQVPGRRALQGPRHQHHRLRRVRRARARHRGPDPRLRNVVDQEERASRQDRLHLAGGRGADPRGRSGQAPHLARPQADHAQSVGGVRREVSARHRRSRARSRTRPSSACSSASTATSTAWSISPTSTGSVRASR